MFIQKKMYEKAPSWTQSILNPAVMLNVVLCTIEMILLGEQERQFGTNNVALILLAEFIKTILTTGIIVILWKSRLYVSAYTIALLPFILIIPALIMMVANSNRYRNMVNQQ